MKESEISPPPPVAGGELLDLSPETGGRVGKVSQGGQASPEFENFFKEFFPDKDKGEYQMKIGRLSEKEKKEKRRRDGRLDFSLSDLFRCFGYWRDIPGLPIY